MANLSANVRSYFNTPEVIARIGKWRNDILARVGAYGQGVFRNRLSRPQLKQTKDRTVYVVATLTNPTTGKIWHYKDTLFVPRRGVVVSTTTRKPAPKAAARIALQIVSARLKGQGAGKPPRMGPGKQLKRFNEFALDLASESVVIGTRPLPGIKTTTAASNPQNLNEGLQGWIYNKLLPAGKVLASYSAHPYVESVLEPAQNKLTQLIKQRPI